MCYISKNEWEDLLDNIQDIIKYPVFLPSSDRALSIDVPIVSSLKVERLYICRNKKSVCLDGKVGGTIVTVVLGIISELKFISTKLVQEILLLSRAFRDDNFHLPLTLTP